MRKRLSLGLVLSAVALVACSKESPELIPCMCNASDYLVESPGLFDCMCEKSKKKPVRRISYVQDKQKVRYQSLIIDQEQYQAYDMLHKGRNSYASVKLENVDFRIKKGRKYDEFNSKLGDYKFRLFGCRREAKNAYLNEGRTIQKDMHFFDVFYETLNDFYPVVVDRSNVYYPDSDQLPYPEYVITAEITDYFMNICDEFDWEIAKNKRLRSGTSEMTVVWRIMNLRKDTVYCRGTTTGYGQVMEGEPNGENLLVERAFEDALVKLPEISCVNPTLLQRIRPQDIERQLVEISRNQRCDECFERQYAPELRGVEMLQNCDMEMDSSKSGYRTRTEYRGGEYGYETEGGYGAQSADGVKGSYYSSNGGSVPVKYIPVTYVEKQKMINSPDMAGLSMVDRDKIDMVHLQFDGVTSQKCSTPACWQEVEMKAQVRDRNFAMRNDCREIQIVEEECPMIKSEENITVSDDFFVDIPLEIEVQEEGGTRGDGKMYIETISEKSFANVNSKFCIVNNPPFENLRPQNLYRLRSSIVSVNNARGQKGAGLIIADNLVLTSADLVVKDNNVYNLKTINGKEFKASAFRVNPNKNVAVLMLDEPTEYTPLPMELKLPEVNKDILLTLGMLDFDENGENYIDNEGRVVGYRYSEDKGAEIIVDTFVQTVTLGGALIDQKGNIIGIAHKSKKDDNLPDLFIPIETALKAVGLEICGQRPSVAKPKAVRIYTPIADAIDNSGDKRPKPVKGLKRK